MGDTQGGWILSHFASGACAIRGHNRPEFARIVLLDDINKLIYRPIGCNSYHEVLYNEFPYPVSHACAVEEETITAWVKAQELLKQMERQFGGRASFKEE